MTGDSGLAPRARFLEWAIAGLLIALFSYLLLVRLYALQEAAEKAHVEAIVKNIDAALRLRQVQAQLAGQSQTILKLAEENPINWLEKLPAGYAGETEAIDFQRLLPGEWRFEKRRKWVFYRPVRSDELTASGTGDEKILAWKALAGGRLQPVAPYRWDVLSD